MNDLFFFAPRVLLIAFAPCAVLSLVGYVPPLRADESQAKPAALPGATNFRNSLVYC